MLTPIADIGSAVIGAAAAAGFGLIGYLLKAWSDRLREGRRQREARRSRLRELLALLNESRDLFVNQNYKARQLLTMLERNHAESLLRDGAPFDEIFRRLYPSFTEEERELFGLIRGTTVNSMRRVNEELRQWLRQNPEFRSSSSRPGAYAELAEHLEQLERHLNDWFDKYEATMHDETHSLVYMADERRHGRGFPRGIESSVKRAEAALPESA